MSEEEFDLVQSPLSQTATSNGKSVDIEIYGDGKNDWILEVVDEYGNSTVWDDPFDTDRKALDEALDTIKKEGIDVLIGPPSSMH